MNDSVLRAVREWLQPRPNLHWMVLGDANPDGLKVLFDDFAASRVTVIAREEAAAEALKQQSLDERVTVRVDDYAALQAVSGVVDAALLWDVLTSASEPFRVITSVARVSRLYAPIVAVEENKGQRRKLWDLFLDARLNDVLTRELDEVLLVRGSR